LGLLDAIFVVKSLAPHVYVGIMRPVMMRLLPLLVLLSLTACDAIPGLLGTAASTVASTAASTAANAAAAAADPNAPATPSVTTTTATAGATTTTATTTTPAPTTPSSATKTVSFDTSKKLEYVDVWVNMGDPTGQRALVPYLMAPKEWMLVGCDMTSISSKHYRFMKVSTTDGKELPSVDIYSSLRR
jgi:hypothetical protein